jgi:hypothetical protein
MTKNFAANLKIGAVMGSSVGRVFGGVNKRIKEQESALKKLRASYKDAAKGTGEFTGSLEKMQKEIKDSEQELKRLRDLSKLGLGGVMGKVGSTFMGDAKRLAVGAGIATAAIAAVGASVYSVTRGFVDWADDIGDSAEALGMSTQALQTWQFAAATVGVGGAKMTASVARFSKAIMEGGDATDETLGKLTINAARLRKLSLDEQLEVVAEAFKNYKGADKAALSMKLFGKSGYQLAGILSKGKQGLDDFRKAGEETGAVLTDEAAAAAGEAASVLDMFGITLVGLRNTIAIQFVPALKSMTEQFIRLVRDNGPKIREWATKFGAVLEANVVPAIGKMIEKLPGIIDGVSKFATKLFDGAKAAADFLGGWDKLAYALIAMNFAPTIAAIGTMVASLWTLTGATWAAVGPWLALAAAVGSVIYIFNNLDTVGEKVNGFLDAIIGDGYTTMMGDALNNLVWFITEDIPHAFTELGNTITTFATNASNAIRDAFASVFAWLITQFDMIGNKIAAIWDKAKALGESVKNFFGFGASATPTSAPVTPAESMPDRSTSMNQSNSFNINVNAPGADGRRIADQIRNEFNRKPLFDMDGALAPG